MLQLSAQIRTEEQEKLAAWPRVHYYIMESEASFTWLYNVLSKLRFPKERPGRTMFWPII